MWDHIYALQGIVCLVLTNIGPLTWCIVVKSSFYYYVFLLFFCILHYEVCYFNYCWGSFIILYCISQQNPLLQCLLTFARENFDQTMVEKVSSTQIFKKFYKTEMGSINYAVLLGFDLLCAGGWGIFPFGQLCKCIF